MYMYLSQIFKATLCNRYNTVATVVCKSLARWNGLYTFSKILKSSKDVIDAYEKIQSQVAEAKSLREPNSAHSMIFQLLYI